MAALERRHQRVARVEGEGVADRASSRRSIVVPVSAARRSSRSRNSRSTASGSVPGSQRRVPSSQASWGYWLKISPRVDLADEDARRPADRVGRGGELVVEPAEPRDQLGGGGDHARLVGGPHHLVDRRPFAADDGLPASPSPGRRSAGRRRAARGAGRRRRRCPSRISWSSWRPSPQGASCRSWAVSRTEPAARAPASRRRADRLDGGGDPRLHVRGPAAGEPAVLDRGRHERQVDRVEVAVELERPARPAAVEADRDRRRRRMPGRRSVRP